MNKSQLIASALLCSLLSVTAVAEPQGGTVRAGSATITQTLDSTTIFQHTGKAIVDWQRFSVNANELVRFVQPSEMAVILNRVTGGDPSVILGKLQANGQVFLVNPNGVLFGPGAQVDVGGLLATTLSLSDQDFLSGNYRFVQDPGFDLASVVNQGEIRVSSEGYVILTAPLVSNEGLIVANLGKVALLGGTDVTVNLDGRNLVNYQLGATPAEDGTVVLTPAAVSNVLRGVVNNSQMLEAGEIVEENGQIHLVGTGGTVLQAGTIDANGGAVMLNSTQLTALAPGSLTAAQGGLVDTSTRRNLNMQGEIQVGGGGEWLIDPMNLTVVNSYTGNNQILASDISTALSSDTNVTLDAEGMATDVPINNPMDAPPGTISIPADVSIVKSAGVSADLTLRAGSDSGSILIDGDISSTSGTLNLTLEPGNAGSVSLGVTSAIDTNGGFFESGQEAGTGGTFSQASGSTLQTGLGDVSIAHQGGIQLASVSSLGNVSLTTTGILFEGGSDAAADVSGGTLAMSALGGIDLEVDSPAITVDAGNSVLLTNLRDAATTVDFTMMGGGEIYFTQVANDVVIDVGSTAGSVFLTANDGDLEVTQASIFNETAELSLTTVASGDILLGQLLAATLTVDAAGSIQEGSVPGPIQAQDVSLTAGTGIGTVATPAISFTQSLSATTTSGDIDLDLNATGVVDVNVANAGAGSNQLTDTSGALLIVTADVGGDLTLASPGDLVLDDVTAGNNVVVTTDGDLYLNQVVATSQFGASADNILEDGDDAEIDVTSAAISLTALGDIGLEGEPDLSTQDLFAEAMGEVDLNNESALTTTADLLAGNGDLTLVQTGGGTLVVTSAEVTGGTLTLANDGGALEVTLASSSGPTDDIVLTALGDISLGNVQTDANLTVTSGASIQDLGNDVNTDAVAAMIDLTAVTGVGSAGNLELSSPQLIAVTDTGGLNLVNRATTASSADLTVTSDGNITFFQRFGHALNLTASGPDQISVNNDEQISLSSVTGRIVNVATLGMFDILPTYVAGTTSINLTAGGAIPVSQPSVDPVLEAPTIALQAAFEIGGMAPLVVDANSLSAASTNGGAIDLIDIDGLTVTSATTPNGTLDIQALTGNLVVTSANASGAVSLQATTGDVLLGDVTAGSGAQIDAAGAIGESTPDPEADLTTSSANLMATGDIDLDLDSFQVDASTDVGHIDLENFNDSAFVFLTVSTTGDIDYVQHLGNLDLNASTPGGTIDVLNSSGEIEISDLNASEDAFVQAAGDVFVRDAQAGDLLAITSGGSIEEGGEFDPNVDFFASRLTLIADNGIGVLDTLEASVDTELIVSNTVGATNLDSSSPGATAATLTSGGGPITLNHSGGGTLTVTGSLNGNLTVHNFVGDLALADITTSGPNRTITASASKTSDLLLGRLVVASGQLIGDGNLIESLGPGLRAVVPTADLSASVGIGTLGVVRVGSSSIVADTGTGGINLGNLATSATQSTLVAGTGDLTLAQTGGFPMTVTQATTGSGNINLSSAGSLLELTQVQTAGGGVTVTTPGRISAGLVSATGALSLTSTGNSIQELGTDPNTDLFGASIALSGSQGIGTLGALEIATNSLTAGSTTGDIQLLNRPTMTADVSLTGGEDVVYQQSMGQLLSLGASTAVGTFQATNNAGISVSGLTANAVQLTSNGASGRVEVGAVTGISSVAITSSGAIEELEPLDAAADITGGTVSLTAATGIGVEDTLETDVNSLSASVSGVGGIFLSDLVGFVATNVTTANGDIDLTAAAGNLNAGTITAGGTGDITLSALMSTVLLGNVSAPGDRVTVTAVGSIQESGDDTATDLRAAVLDLAAGFHIGSLGAIEITGDTLTAQTTLGDINLLNRATMATTVTLTSGDDLTYVQSQGFALDLTDSTADASLTITNNADITFDHLSAGTTATITSGGGLETYNDGGDVVLTATSATLSAASGIGTTLDLRLEVDALAAQVTGAGSVHVADANALSATTVSTFDGDIELTTETGSFSAANLTAGGSGSISLTSLNGGQMELGNVSAAGNLVDVTSTGAILELGSDSNPDVTATLVSLSAAGPIDLDLAASTIDASTTLGGLDLTNQTADANAALYAATGDINFNQEVGGLTVITADSASGSVSLLSQTTLNASDISAAGAGNDVTLANLTVGSQISVGTVNAPDTITVNSAGAIEEVFPGPALNLTAPTIALSANSGIGNLDALELLFSNSLSASTASGALNVVSLNPGPVSISLTNLGTGLNSFSHPNPGTVRFTSGTLGGNLALNVLDDLIVENLTATNAAGVISLTAGAGDDVFLRNVQGAGTVNVTGDRIEEFGADGGVALSAAQATLSAQTGIGLTRVLDLAVTGLTASSAANNLVLRNQPSSAATVSLTANGTGSISFTQQGGAALNLANVQNSTGVITISNQAGAMNIGRIVSENNVTLTTVGGSLEELGADTNTDIISPLLTLSGGTGIGTLGALEISTNGFNIQSTTGDINLLNRPTGTVSAYLVGGEDVVYTQSMGQTLTAIELNAAGSLQVSNNATMDLTLAVGGTDIALATTAGGDVLLGFAQAPLTTIDSSGSILERLGGDVQNDIQGNATLSAVDGIGTAMQALGVSGTLRAHVTGPGNLYVDNVVGTMRAVDVTTAAGDIFLTSNAGVLQATSVVAGGAGDITLNSGLSVQVDNVVALGDMVTVVAGTTIIESGSDATADIQAAAINLTAALSIGVAGTPELASPNVTASATTGNLILSNLAPANTTVTLTAGHDISYVQSGGFALSAASTSATRNLTFSNDGAVRLGLAGAGNTLTIVGSTIDELGSDAGADLVAPTILLTATSGIGTMAGLEIDADALTAQVTGAGNLALHDVDALTATNVTTAAGNITLTSASGGLNAVFVNAGGNGDVTLQSSNGGLRIQGVSAVGNSVSLLSDQDIRPLNLFSDVTAATVGLTAQTGIELDVNASSVTAATASGGIDLLNLLAAGSTVALDANSSNATYVQQTGPVVVTSASGSVVSLSTGSGDLTVDSADAGGDLFLTSAGGDVLIGLVTAGDVASIQSGAGIEQSGSGDAESDVIATTVLLDATTGIGTVAGLQVSVGNTLGVSTDDGSIDLDSTSSGAISVSLANLSTDGDDTLLQHTSTAALTLASATASSGDLRVESTDGDLSAVSVHADGTGAVITLLAGPNDTLYLGQVSAPAGAFTNDGATPVGSVQELSPDAGVDVTAQSVWLEATGNIGSLDSLELATASVTATSSGGSVTLSNSSTGTATAVLSASTGITFVQSGGATLDLTAQTQSGSLTATNDAGPLNATDVRILSGGGTLSLSGLSDLAVGFVSGPGTVELASGDGSVAELGTDANTDVTAGTLVLSAQTDIGGVGNALEVSASTLTANATTGGIFLLNRPTAATTVQLTGAGAVYTQTLGFALNLAQASVTSLNVSNNAATTLGMVLADSVDVTTTGAGSNLLVNQVSALNSATLNASGAIEESGADAGVDIQAPNLSLTAGTGIGAAGALELQVSNLSGAVTGAGLINLTNTTGLNVSGLTTANGSITVLTEQGDLNAFTVTAGGDGDISLTASQGQVLLDSVNAAGNTVNLAGLSLGELGNDTNNDLTGAVLNLTATGTIESLELSGTTVTATTTGSILGLLNRATANTTVTLSAGDDLAFSQTGGFVLGLTSASAPDQVQVSNNADINATGVSGATTSLTATGAGSDIFVGQATGTTSLSLTAGGSLEELTVDAGADLIAPMLTLSAGTGIGVANALEVQTDTLTAAVTGAGSLNLIDLTGTLNATNVTTGNGSIALTTSAGHLTAANVNAGGNGDVTLSAAGNALLGNVQAAGNQVTVNATGTIRESGSDAGLDVVAATVTLAAPGVIDTLELSATTVNATSSGASVNLTNQVSANSQASLSAADDLTFVGSGGFTFQVLSASAPDNVQLTNQGNLNVTSATGATMSLISTLGNVAANQATGTTSLTVNAPQGAIEELGADAGADLVSPTLGLTASTGIGAVARVELDATTLTAQVTGAGPLWLRDTSGGVTASSVSTSGGNLTLESGAGDLNAVSVIAGGAGSVALSSTGGNVNLQSVTAAGDTISVTSTGSIVEVSPDAGADLTAATVNLTAATGIGLNGGAPELDATTLTVSNTTSGNVVLSDLSGGLTVASLTTNNGNVTLQTNDGNLVLENANLQGTGSLSAFSFTSGDIQVGLVQATGDTVTLFAAGQIIESADDAAADIVAANMNLSGFAGVGTAARPLEIDATVLDASVDGPAGGIFIQDTAGPLTVNTAIALSGSIALTGRGNVTLNEILAGGDLTVTGLVAGNLLVRHMSAQGDVTLTTVGSIVEDLPDAAVDISALGTMRLTAGTGIGPTSTLEIETTTLVANVTGAGGIDLKDLSGGVIINNTSTANGNIAISAHNGDMRATSVIAGGAGRSATLTITGVGSMQVGLVQAAGAVTLDSVGNVTEFGADAASDVVAGGNSFIIADGGVIGNANALEVNITNATLSVLATSSVGGVSVRIDGTVSPTNALIKLATPPGTVLLNGVVQ